MKLPEGLPQPPDGYVYLGRGGEFKLLECKSFMGRIYHSPPTVWGSVDTSWIGHDPGYHYCAIAGSEIVNINRETNVGVVQIPEALDTQPKGFKWVSVRDGLPTVKDAYQGCVLAKHQTGYIQVVSWNLVKDKSFAVVAWADMNNLPEYHIPTTKELFDAWFDRLVPPDGLSNAQIAKWYAEQTLAWKEGK